MSDRPPPFELIAEHTHPTLAAGVLELLDRHGYVIVHPDDYPRWVASYLPAHTEASQP